MHQWSNIYVRSNIVNSILALAFCMGNWFDSILKYRQTSINEFGCENIRDKYLNEIRSAKYYRDFDKYKRTIMSMDCIELKNHLDAMRQIKTYVKDDYKHHLKLKLIKEISSQYYNML